MKLRRCFVSNSSSSSFIINLTKLSEEQTKLLHSKLDNLNRRHNAFIHTPEDEQDYSDYMLFNEYFDIEFSTENTVEITVNYDSFEEIGDMLAYIGLHEEEHYEIGGY